MGYLDGFNKSNASAEQQAAFKYIITDLLRDNKRGSDKSQTIGASNMEDTYPASFVPSLFYVFLYIGGQENKMGTKTFYDMVPVILCTGFDGSKVTGINFNFIPNNVRAGFMDLLTNGFKKYYEEDIFEESPKVDETLGFLLSNPKELSTLMAMAKDALHFDFSACVRSYDIKNIYRPRMIENDMLDAIVNLSFSDAVRGINLAKLQMQLISEK